MPNNGHIRIPNDVWEALTICQFPNSEISCILFILRRTIGWNKFENEISYKSFTKATGLDRHAISKAIKKLKAKHIIFVVKNDNKTDLTFRFNMKITTWKPLSKLTTVVKIDNNSLSKLTTTPYINKKDINTLSSHESRREKDEAYLSKNGKSYRIAKLLFKLISERDRKIKEPNWIEWTKQIERLNRIDNRDFIEIRKVILWCQKDDFWKNNILSTAKLRKQFIQLSLKMNNKPKISTRDFKAQRQKTNYQKSTTLY